MTKIAGIIAEYNPFHRGHAYHLNQTREITGAEAVVVVMSGDFTQRGGPALVDRRRRARMALAAGADAVLELPVSAATGSAERFAAGGVEILDRLGIVTDLVFGCECRTPEENALLFRTAEFLACETEKFREELAANLRKGGGFAAARAAAAEKFLPGSRTLLRSPNNILAVEYLKALQRRKSDITPHAIPRLGESYHSLKLSEGFSSASAIRNTLTAYRRNTGRRLSAGEYRRLDPHAPLWRELPEASVSGLPYQLEEDDFSTLLTAALLAENPETLCRYQDVSPELAARLYARRLDLIRFGARVDAARSRNFPASRVRRALTHILLHLPEQPLAIPAVRLLGFRAGSPVMRRLADQTGIPVVTRLPDAPEEWFVFDCRAAHLYRLVTEEKTGVRLPDEYRSLPVIYES